MSYSITLKIMGWLAYFFFYVKGYEIAGHVKKL